jgi:hypothetical protein
MYSCDVVVNTSIFKYRKSNWSIIINIPFVKPSEFDESNGQIDFFRLRLVRDRVLVRTKMQEKDIELKYE